MKTVKKTVNLNPTANKAPKLTVNKKLDRIKKVTFTSNKTEEIGKLNIVINF